jgi:hypothetical protein
MGGRLPEDVLPQDPTVRGDLGCRSMSSTAVGVGPSRIRRVGPVEGFWCQEQHLARGDDHLSMPHSLRNDARLTLTEMEYPFVLQPELSAEEHGDDTFDQVEQLVLMRMHLPLVAFPRCVDSEQAYPATIELHR